MSNQIRERDRIDLSTQQEQHQSISLSSTLTSSNDTTPTIEQLYQATINGNIDLMKLLITNKVNPFEIYSTDMFDLYQLSPTSSTLSPSIKDDNFPSPPTNNLLFFASILSNSTLIIDYVINHFTPYHIQQLLLQSQHHHHQQQQPQQQQHQQQQHQQQLQTNNNNNDIDEIIQIKSFAFLIGLATNKFTSIQHLTTKYNITLDDTILMKYLPYILRQGNMGATEYLLQHHNIIQYFNTTLYPQNGLFHRVVESGNIELVHYIINHGDIIDDINQLNELQQPPLYIAAINFEWDIVRLLIESNATPESILSVKHDNDEQFSLLHHAVCDKNISIEFIDYLINDIGIDIESTTGWYTTPILTAAWKNNLGILKYLVEKHNADVHVVDGTDNNLFHYAIMAEHDCTPELISYINAHDVEIQNTHALDGEPIDLAIEHCRIGVVQEFIDCGADISIRINGIEFNYPGDCPAHEVRISRNDHYDYDDIGVLLGAAINTDVKVMELVRHYFFNHLCESLPDQVFDSIICSILQQSFEVGNFNVLGYIYNNCVVDCATNIDNFFEVLATSRIKPNSLSTLLDLYPFDINQIVTVQIHSLGETLTATTLCAAVYNPSNSIELIKLIIDRGVNINRRTENGYNVLHFLLFSFHDSRSPENQFEILHYLLQSGADIEVISTKSETTLHIAAVNPGFELISILIEHYIDQLMD